MGVGGEVQVPCVAAVENMSYFDGDDGKRYYPFGSGSGERVRDDFGVPHLLRFPISSAISSAGDGTPPPHAASCHLTPPLPPRATSPLPIYFKDPS